MDTLVLNSEEHFCLMQNIRRIESRFGVRIDSLNKVSDLTYLPSDVFFVTVSGEGENLILAAEFIRTELTKGKIFPYSKELEIIFENTVSKQALEKMYDIRIMSMPGKSLVFSGTSDNIAAVFSFVQEFSEIFKLKSSGCDSELSSQIAGALLCYQKFFLNMKKLRNLPKNVQISLLSWFEKILLELRTELNGKDKECDMSSALTVDHISASKDVPVITVSDSESDGDDTLKVGSYNRKKRRKHCTEFSCSNDIKNSSCQSLKSIQECCDIVLDDFLGKDEEGLQTDVSAKIQQEEEQIKTPRIPRPVIIDGYNIAREHGNATKQFSCRGILKAIEYFENRGHSNIKVFVPCFLKNSSSPNIVDPHILKELIEKQIVELKPKAYKKGTMMACYHRCILEYAQSVNAIILSNCGYKDVMEKDDALKEVAEKSILMYCFANDEFMVPTDPLGKDGPHLDEFLTTSSIS